MIVRKRKVCQMIPYKLEITFTTLSYDGEVYIYPIETKECTVRRKTDKAYLFSADTFKFWVPAKLVEEKIVDGTIVLPSEFIVEKIP